jgi:23S rRNA pseudouridine1911/1915/1917 synthase
MDPKSVFTLRAGVSDVGKRMDVFISGRLSHMSRSFIANLIRTNKIQVNAQFRKPGYIIKKDDLIQVELPPPRPSGFLPEPMNISVLYEDQHLVVVNKPPGLVVHPAPGHTSGTLVNGLLYLCPDLKGIGGELRPGIVHRLDKDTSGVLLVAKDDRTHQSLSAQFKERSVKKEYIALVYGEMTADSGKIDLPIGRHPLHRKKMSTVSSKTREAETQWRVLSRFNGVSLVGINLKTGRTHQIRVHFSAIHHPIVGDPVYAGKSMIKTVSLQASDLIKTVKRQMLHAFRITFIHPDSGQVLSFEAPVPGDMADLIELLHSCDMKAQD